MKLLQKLAPVAIFASTAAVVVPFATSCGKGWTSFSARTFDEDKYKNNVHSEVTNGWDRKTMWDDFGKNKSAFDMSLRYYTNVMYEEISSDMEDVLVDFPSFDVKYKNFKAELDPSNNPFISYDLEIFEVFDIAPEWFKSNGTEQGRVRQSLSISIHHVPVTIDCDPVPTNVGTWKWSYSYEDDVDQWTDESNLKYTETTRYYLYKDGNESFIREESGSCECNTKVGTELGGYAGYMVNMSFMYYYQKVQRNW